MTYTIHRYPAELIDVLQLGDGRRVTIRPVLPQDAGILQAFVQALSDSSRRHRFFRTIRELPASLLDQFTQVDYHRHLALVAEVFTDGVETIVGEARYVRDDHGSGAEFAVAIADAWQSRGIARALVERLLERAAAEGVTHVHGQTLATNRSMQRLARATGFSIAWEPQAGGLLRLHKALVETHESAEDRPAEIVTIPSVA